MVGFCLGLRLIVSLSTKSTFARVVVEHFVDVLAKLWSFVAAMAGGRAGVS